MGETVLFHQKIMCYYGWTPILGNVYHWVGSMHVYLLAINLFALTAFFLGFLSFSGETRHRHLLPLLMLVLSHSLTFLVSLMATAGDIFLALGYALTIFSTLCVAWSLAGSAAHLPAPWPRLAQVAGVGAVGLALLTLLPGWPVPHQIQIILVAIGGGFFVYLTRQETIWPHLGVLFLLALAGFVDLLGLMGTAQLIGLLGYALLIGVVHQQSLQAYITREQVAQDLVQEVYDLNWERQRLLEVSETMSNVPNLNHTVEHILRSLAQATQTDQTAIFTISNRAGKQARLLSLYSPHHPFRINNQGITFNLSACPPLKEIVDRQQQLLLPQSSVNGLHTLYNLWSQEQAGPTLLQPLMIQQQLVGVLMVGNPISQAPIRQSDARLCDSLAAQIATMVEHRRRYLELEREAQTMSLSAKKQRQQPDRQQAAILEAISDGVIIINAQGRVDLVNQAAERVLGKPGRVLIGQPAKAVYRALDARQPMKDLIAAFAKRKQPLPTFIENEERAIQGRLIPWRDAEDEFLGIIAVFRDVTREVRADQARNDFISALSHELRPPLTVITGYSELISNGMMGDYPPQQMQIQHIIYQSAKQVSEILDNAIKVSAQNRHRILPRFEEIDAAKIIDNAIREVLSLVRHYELNFTRDIKADLPLIVADPRHLHRIVYNILSNACRFTPPGGQIALRAWVELSHWGGVSQLYLFITVADNGVGIPKEEVGRIFDRFYQVKNRPPRGRSGMGMGLTVVKELIDLHKGRVWVESKVGHGTIFRVALPVSQEY